MVLGEVSTVSGIEWVISSSAIRMKNRGPA